MFIRLLFTFVSDSVFFQYFADSTKITINTVMLSIAMMTMTTTMMMWTMWVALTLLLVSAPSVL